MPEVETAQVPTMAPEVAPGGTLTANVSPNAFGANIGQAVEGLGVDMSEAKRIHDRASREADVTASMDMHNKMHDFDTQTFYHGVFDQDLGINAPKVIDKAMTERKAYAAKLSAGLNNDQQREIFNRMVGESTSDLLRQTTRYQDAQLNKHADSVDNANLQNVIESAGRNYNDKVPGQRDPVDRAVDDANAIISISAGRHNLDSLSADRMKRDAAGQIYGTVLDRMLQDDGQIEQAKSFFAEHKDDLPTKLQDHFGKTIKIVDDRNIVARIAPGFVTDIDGQTKSRTQADKDIAKSKYLAARPDLVDAVRQHVDRFFADQDKAKTEQERMAFDGSEKALWASGGDMTKIPAQYAAALSGDHIGALHDLADKIQKNMLPKDGGDTWVALSQMAGADPKGFLEATQNGKLLAYRGSLSQGDFIKLQDTTNRLSGRDSTGADETAWLQTKSKINEQAFSGTGIPINPVRDNTTGKVTWDPRTIKFLTDVDAAVRAQEQQSGKKVDQPAYQKIVDDLMTQQATTKKGWLWDSTEQAPSFLARPKEFAYGIHQVPDDAAQKIRAKAIARGAQPPSQQDIVNAYNAGLAPAEPAKPEDNPTHEGEVWIRGRGFVKKQ